MRKATRRGGWAFANRTRRSPPISVCLCRICSTSLGTDLSVPRPCLWAAGTPRVCPRSVPASAHEIEERGARHLGLHLEGGLKLGVAFRDGERGGGYIGILLLAPFGLHLDAIGGAVVGGVCDAVLHGAVEGLGGIEMIRGGLDGSAGRGD